MSFMNTMSKFASDLGKAVDKGATEAMEKARPMVKKADEATADFNVMAKKATHEVHKGFTKTGFAAEKEYIKQQIDSLKAKFGQSAYDGERTPDARTHMRPAALTVSASRGVGAAAARWGRRSCCRLPCWLLLCHHKQPNTGCVGRMYVYVCYGLWLPGLNPCNTMRASAPPSFV